MSPSVEKQLFGSKRTVTYLLATIGLFSLGGCGLPSSRNEQECQLQGTPSWYCRQTAKKDPLFVKGNSQVYSIPAYTGPKDFPVPEMPVYTDDAVDQTLRASIVLGDYMAALRKVGLLEMVARKGPYTLFAVPNQPMENPGFAVEGSLMDVSNENLLKRLMAYTIVSGDYPPEKLKALIAKQGGSVELTTVPYNDKLIVSLDPVTHELITKNKSGQVNKIWVNGIPQSNGTLYVSQGLLNIVP